MKKIGIVADNYKLAYLEKQLKKSGYEYSTIPFTREATSVFIHVPVEQFQKATSDISKITTKMEYHFKRSN